MTAAEAKAASAPVEPKPKPQKPDEQAFKADLEKAEKELAAVQKRLVRASLFLFHSAEVGIFWSLCSYAYSGVRGLGCSQIEA